MKEPVLYYPTKVGTKWVYYTEQEDKEYTYIISSSDKRPNGYVIGVTQDYPSGLRSEPMQYLAAGHGLYFLQDGKRKCEPPLCMLKMPHTERWSWSYSIQVVDIKINGTCDKGVVERVKVPAGEFESIRVQSYQGNDFSNCQTTWFVAGIGPVKQIRYGGMVQVLKSFTPGKD